MSRSKYDDTAKMIRQVGGGIIIAGVVFLLITGYFVYTRFRIDVPAKHIAVLTHKTGQDLENDDEVAVDESQKGLQLGVLPEGRYFYNPFLWNWKVYPMVEIPEDKMGVRVRLYGDDLPYGHFVATKENEKGIVEDVLKPGRYAINAIVKDASNHEGKLITNRTTSDYVEIVELHDPVSIPAGFKGIVTNLAGPIPEKSNAILVPKGFRGVQKETLEPGTYYLNPYMYRIQPIDCRSQRFDLAKGEDMGFASKDGFWVTLDGIIEFRIKPDSEAETFVMYNESMNGMAAANIGEEVIRKVITPNARSFCRLRGSNSSGKEMIGGETRVAFQTSFQSTIKATCEKQGIEILQALITRINPPQAIAEPVRKREVARQQEKAFHQQKLQQEAEAKLATEKATIAQRQKLVEAEQTVVKTVTMAKQEQEVALQGADRDLEVAIEEYHASKDKAEATLSAKKAEAQVSLFANEADAAGWRRSIQALGGDGEAFARFTLYQKLAPSYKSIMVNTADSPMMDVFKKFAQSGPSVKIDSSKIEPIKIDLPTNVEIPKLERRVRKTEEMPTPVSPTASAPIVTPVPTPVVPTPAKPVKPAISAATSK